MPFYRFRICDPFNPVDGPGHDGAALEDDIDAMLFAAGIIQRLIQEQPGIPGNWAVKISQDGREVSALSFEAGCKVLLRSHWASDQPAGPHEDRR